MAQPTAYNPAYNFSDFQADSPTSPLPADKLDIELNNIQTTLDGVLTNLLLIQRDDGGIANASVGLDQLKSEVTALLSGGGGSGDTSPIFTTQVEALSFKPTGSTVPVYGMYLPDADVLGFSTNSRIQLRVMEDPDDDFPASGTDVSTWLEVGGHRCETAGVADGSVFIIARGEGISSDSYTLRLTATGPYGGIHGICNGYINFSVGAGAQASDHCTYVNVVGAAAGNSPAISAQRTYAADSAAFGLSFYTAGQGNMEFYSDNTTVPLFKMVRVASGVNYLNVGPGASGNNPYFEAKGTNAAVGINLLTKSSGAYGFYTNSSSPVQQFGITHTASAVNWVSVTGNTTGQSAIISAAGETNVGLRLTTKGTGALRFYTDSSLYQQFQISRTASTVNYLNVTGAATGNDPALSAQGSDSTLGLSIYTAGTGNITFKTQNTSSTGFQIIHSADADTYVAVTGDDGGDFVKLGVEGANADILNIYAPGDIIFCDDADGTAEQFEIHITSSAVNPLRVTGGTTGNSPAITARGETNVGIIIAPQGTENLYLGTAVTHGVVVGAGALATTATAGFLWIPSCPGTPTGAPTPPYTNAVALCADTSNHRLYMFESGGWVTLN